MLKNTAQDNKTDDDIFDENYQIMDSLFDYFTNNKRFQLNFA